jgi:hypothetical protein
MIMEARFQYDVTTVACQSERDCRLIALGAAAPFCRGALIGPRVERRMTRRPGRSLKSNSGSFQIPDFIVQWLLEYCSVRWRFNDNQTRWGVSWVTLVAVFAVRSHLRSPDHQRPWATAIAALVGRGPGDP